MFGGGFFPTGAFGSFGDEDDVEDAECESEEERKAGQKADKNRLYDMLGVERDASAPEIKKAYHRKAMLHHPDKGGDVDHFKDIQKAFEVLSDPERRRRYDTRGEEGLEERAQRPEDVFEQMFGGGGPPRGRGGQRPRTKDVVRQLWVTLEELYTGTSRPLPIVRKVIDRQGPNGMDLDAQACEVCAGKGCIMQVVRLPGLPVVQQIQQPCRACGGRGSNAKMRSQPEVLDVFVEKGSPDGHKIVLHGKADEAPGHESGDVQVVVRQQDHHRFLRRGADLYLEQELSLADALTGFRIVVPQLDGRNLVVRSNPGEVLQPSKGMAIKAVAGAGMPIHQDPFNFGNLFLVFTISFPEKLEVNVAREVRKLLGAQPLPADDEELGDGDVEHCVAQDIDPLESSRRPKIGSEAYQEDEDEGPPGMPCKQQ